MPKADFCVRCPVGGEFQDSDKTCSVPDPDDGLPVCCVGDWSEDKHLRLRKYVDISRKVRKKFVSGTGGATYVDMYSGPGRSRIRGTSRIVDGSPIVAAREAINGKVPYSQVHVADTNAEFVTAVTTRLVKLEIEVQSYCGPATETSIKVAANLSRYSLHFAFLDPYDLKSLPFNVIQRLAEFDRMDMLIHVSVQDLQRNLRRYIENNHSPLDLFTPGWRDIIQPRDTNANVRRQLFNYWLDHIRHERMEPSQGVEEVRGTGNQHLYWLVFVARHGLALKFWEEIRNINKQKGLPF